MATCPASRLSLLFLAESTSALIGWGAFFVFPRKPSG
jgi:hypothetical protein